MRQVQAMRGGANPSLGKGRVLQGFLRLNPCAPLTLFCFAALLLISVAGPARGQVGDPVVIDMHTHIFNLRYLPVKGILIARGVPPLVAGVVDRYLVGATDLSDLDMAAADVRPLSEMDTGEAKADIFRRIDNLMRTEGSLSDSERKALRRYLTHEIRYMNKKSEDLRDEELVHAAVEKAKLDPGAHDGDSYFRFLALLMRDELTIAKTFEADYPSVRLAVHHLMDLAKAYDNLPNFDNDHQIAKLPKLTKALDGRFVGFVAFDPFRRGDALTLVKSAIESGAALGVKFYPPSGYSASGNVIPRRPAFWRPALRRQWQSRYRGLHGKDLDTLIYQFLDWAVANDVPILSHCTPTGFEAAAKYGLKSDPRFWEEVLKQPRYHNLRLALGHAGGGDWWFSRSPDPRVPHFDEVALRLARTYPNVYLDFSYASEVLEPAREAIFVDRLREAVAGGGNGPSAASKLMYGSDWHMVTTLGRRRELLTVLQRVFSNPGLETHSANFFAGNAARYLKLNDYVCNPKAPAVARDYLASLLEEGGMTPTCPCNY